MERMIANQCVPLRRVRALGVGLLGLFLLSLVSCGSDDDHPTPEPEAKKASSTRAEYSVSVSQDLLNAATVTVYFIDANGRQAQEALTQTTWTKTVGLASLPTQAGFIVVPQLKGAPTADEYDIEVVGQMKLTVLDQNGEAFETPFVGNLLDVKGVMGADFLGQYLLRISNRVQQAKTIAKDGTIGDTTIDWGGNAGDEDPNINTGISSEGASGTTRNGG